MKDKLKQIIEHYGINNQLKKLNEECYELIEAIRDYEDMYVKCDCDNQYLKYEKEHIEEELSDCLVMINQFKEYYGISDEEISEIMMQKINRQLERIKNEI